MALSSQLVVPMTIWGKKAPAHSVSCLVLSKDNTTLVTGSHEGHLCIWDDCGGQLIPRVMLHGHTSKVVCLATERNHLTNQQLLVSASESGEMSLWDMNDCRCVEAVKLQQVHTDIRAYTLTGAEIPRLFCCGYYAEIIVMDMVSLTVLFTLSSRVDSDWIAAMDIIHPVKRNDDILVALSSTGYMKVWRVDEQEALQNGKVLFEGESKPIDCYHAVGLSCCMYNQRTVLIICPLAWHVYDAGDFSHLCSQEAYNGERWAGGRFLSTDQILSWTNTGKGYIYKIPQKAVPGTAQFHTVNVEKPNCIAVLQATAEPNLVHPPSSNYFLLTRDTLQKHFIQGDANGAVYRWKLHELELVSLAQPVLLPAVYSTSLQASWDQLNPPPVGILDGIDIPGAYITASAYLPIQGQLACGRSDGSIVIISVIHCVMAQILWGAKHLANRQLLTLGGHQGKVTALLYPHNVNTRYDVAHLVSGGVDFSVCLWDLYSGSLLHRFSVHSGEIQLLQVPPDSCSQRVLQCICSIGADHAVSLLHLKDRKCILLASRHLFPVTNIKWRPLDDFMIVGCADGSVYVWQMETCHLDRVIQGMMAEDILNACDENVNATGEKISNPALHLLRGLRHRNISAIKHAAQRGLVQLHNTLEAHNQRMNDPTLPYRAHPLVIQGLRTQQQTMDGCQQDSHVFFFDIEALIVQLLSEEYSQMTPGTLESQGFTNQTEYVKYYSLASLPDANKTLAGFIAKVKDTAESAASKIQATAQATAESVGIKSAVVPEAKSKDSPTAKPGGFMFAETNQTMQIAQLLLSQLHAWGLDQGLDQVCQAKLGLLLPIRPAHFGLLSRSGHMALFLPTHMYKLYPATQLSSQASGGPARSVTINVAKEVLQEEERARRFASQGHWELAKALTTNHLLSLVALANTLMSMNSATFIDEQERRRKLNRKLSRADSRVGSESAKQAQDAQNNQNMIKDGWSRLATHHCVQLPELVKSDKYKRPQLEMLARRWQDRCLEVREAAQALLLAELRSIGPEGRRKVIDSWSLFLPNYSEHQLPPLPGQPGHPGGAPTGATHNPAHEDGEESEDDDDDKIKLLSAVTEAKRKQSTAVVLLAVIGATYGSAELEKKTVSNKDVSLTRHTAQALSYLLLSQACNQLPAHTSLRRAAIDLIGRGFTVWEHHLDVTRVLIGLLELCCNSDKLVPTMTYGLPLTPSADSCRSARHSLSLIATARPPVFITTLAKEVHRYNALAQNAQTLPTTLSQTVLHRAKPEIIRIVELLIERVQNDVHDLLVEVMDIVLHCLDASQLKLKGLQELFPAVCRFHNVTHCSATRRIAVGAKSGSIALYELKAAKCQNIVAHKSPVTAVAFSPEGKYLASYAAGDDKLSFWQTASGLFGLGNSQTKCLKTCNTPALPETARNNPLRMGRLIWPTNKSVYLILDDGTQHPFSL
ncbi:WD repeat-containing protein 7 [Galendromus occidentalis]|uniref:WD repeat-containing protein 7 n=1 Tax=Galendromus occidentalis TaxID=34638 RepID=A0AAJ6QSP1_9ACAR|nr:WD repeat-containing protein 7 [Galendromus occidentalis]